MKKTRILVAGIGAVGGYFGAKLAAHYSASADVEICFLARGENMDVIRQNGLRLETTSGNLTAKPALISSDPKEIGLVDLVILCTKSYDLEETLKQLEPSIGPQTIILPLLNGVDSYERIKAVLPDTEVWDGCVYIVSRLIEPGLVRETGNIAVLFFGSDEGDKDHLKQFEGILKAAGIDARLSDDIRKTIWEKFLFISTLATQTSFSDKSIGAVLENESDKKTLEALFSELYAIAKASGIALEEGTIQTMLNRMSGLPYDTTSSMHSDFQKENNRTELGSLTGYVVRLADKLHLPAPEYHKMYEALLQRENTNR